MLAAQNLLIPNVAQRFAVCRERQTIPFGGALADQQSADNVRYVRLLRKAAILIVSFGRLQAGGPLASQTGPPSFSGAIAREWGGSFPLPFVASRFLHRVNFKIRFISLRRVSIPPGLRPGGPPPIPPVLRSSPRRGAASASAFPLLPASAPASFRCGLKPRLIAPPLRRSRFSASLPASPSKFFYPTSTASRPAKPPRDRRAAAFAATSRPRFSALRADLRTVASARLRAVSVAP